MQSQDVKIHDRISAVEAIKNLGEEDLYFLHNVIVERLNLLSQARSTVEMSSFTKGDHVVFTARDGQVINGRVMRLNKKTVSILSDDGHKWNVAPSFLKRLNTDKDIAL